MVVEVLPKKAMFSLTLLFAVGCANDFELVVRVGSSDTSRFTVYADGEAHTPTQHADGRAFAEFTRHFPSVEEARSSEEIVLTITESDVELFRRAVRPGVCDQTLDWQSEEWVYAISRPDGVARLSLPLVTCRDGDHVSTISFD